MGQVPTLGTLFRRKETTIKREWRETEVRRAETPITQEAPEKAPRTVPRTNPLW